MWSEGAAGALCGCSRSQRWLAEYSLAEYEYEHEYEYGHEHEHEYEHEYEHGHEHGWVRV